MSSDPYRLPGDPSLPPGVSDRDIDPPMIECETCWGEGTIFYDYDDNGEPLVRECPDCGGSGSVRK